MKFRNWLEVMKKRGFHIPNLSCAFRNSKQIIDYDRVYTDSIEIKKIRWKHSDHFHCLPPTEGWPCSAVMKVTTPSNQTCGPTPVQIEYKGSLDESIAVFPAFPTISRKSSCHNSIDQLCKKRKTCPLIERNFGKSKRLLTISCFQKIFYPPPLSI